MAKKLYDEEGNVVKGAKVKKPFYKKWWFIALVVVVIIGAIGGGDDEESAEVSEPETEEVKVVEETEETEAEEVEEETEVVEEEVEEVEEEPIIVTADEILNDYVDNEVNANKVYKGELVQVTGELYSISETDSGKVSIVIKPESNELWLESMSVELEDSTGIENVSTGSEITVKGTADTGIFYTVVLKKASIVQ